MCAPGPGGFQVLEDRQDGYAFNYPFGWQEVSISGADIVFKDVIEPLESVSVTMVKATKDTIAEYGSVEEVRPVV
jgi:photosystem II oxygen-evolving enhancer protein 2